MTKALTNKLLGSPVIELANDSDSIDTYSLCASKHEAWIYVTDEDGSGVPNAVDDSIIVAFSGTDTSGAGCIDAIFEGMVVFVTDPEEWQSTVDKGYDIIWDRADNCSGAWDCTYDYTSATVYSGVYFATTGVKAIASGVGSVAKKLKFWSEEETMSRSIFGADNVTVCNPRKGESGEFWGTTYHNQNGGEHKVKITINKLYQGKTTTVYQSELAGGDTYRKVDGKLLFEPSFRKFKLTGPGTYTINVESLAANMDCGNPSLDLSTTIEVAAAPADPDEGSEDGTVETLNEGITGISEATGVRPLYLYGGIVLVGGLLVSRYLDLFTGGRSE